MALELESVSIRPPGLFGLNTEQAVSVSDPRWALEFSNAVFDSANRPAARKGWSLSTTIGGHTDDTLAVHEYVGDATTFETISAAGNKIYRGENTLTDVTGTVTTPTDDNWQFLNFNGKCVGIQASHTPIVYTSPGSFADITAGSGSLPTGNAGLSAWGRLFVTDSDEITIKWCGLLDETDWGGAGAGNLDTASVWPDGLDTVTGLAQWFDRLIIFGTRSVLIYTGAEDPTNSLTLEDIVERAGCVGRDSIHAVGEDLLYLSQDGLRSLSRGIESSTLPLNTLSTPVKRDLIDSIKGASNSDIKAAYSPEEGFYLLRLGASYWMFDLKLRLETGDLRASRWYGNEFLSVHTHADGNIYFGRAAPASGTGGISKYDTYLDNDQNYQFRYLSTWMDLDSDRVKISKKAQLTILTEGDYPVLLKWAYDWGGNFRNDTVTLAVERDVSEWSGDTDHQPATVAEWGTAEWSGGTSVVDTIDFCMSGYGHRLQVGIAVDVEGKKFAIQELRLLAKIGRLAA